MRGIQKLVRAFSKLSAFLIIALSFLVVYDAVNRYFFGGGSIALQELEWHLFDIIFLLGLSFTLQMDKHVRVDLFYSNYSPKTKAIVDIISQIFLILPFVLLILYVSFDYIALSYNQNEISPDPGGLAYRWAIKSMMVVGFVLLGLQSVAEIVKNLKIIKADR